MLKAVLLENGLITIFVKFVLKVVLLALMELNVCPVLKERVSKEHFVKLIVMMAIIQRVRFANNVMKHALNALEEKILIAHLVMKDIYFQIQHVLQDVLLENIFKIENVICAQLNALHVNLQRNAILVLIHIS